MSRKQNTLGWLFQALLITGLILLPIQPSTVAWGAVGGDLNMANFRLERGIQVENLGEPSAQGMEPILWARRAAAAGESRMGANSPDRGIDRGYDLADETLAAPADTGLLSCSRPTRIMPVGDSITRGSSSGVSVTVFASYRRKLWDDLQSFNYWVDFVGAADDAQQDGSQIPNFDEDHEGHGGWHAAGGGPSKGNGVVFNIYNWLDTNPADIVLLHIGTNDVSNNDQNAAEISQILNEIDRYSPNVPVVLALIINRVDDGDPEAARTTTFNNNVRTMAASRINAGDTIAIVDMENDAGMIYQYQADGGDFFDEVHPAPSGYEKMAVVWLDSLADILPVCANDDQADAMQGTERIVDVLVNDAGRDLRVVAVGGAEPGANVRIISNQYIGYTPASGFSGVDTITYTINDGPSGSDVTGTVAITVSGNNPPAANDDRYDNIDEDSTDNVFNVLDNDSSDPDSPESLTILAVDSISAGGTVRIRADGTALLYSPAPDFYGEETFRYTISDGKPNSTDTAVVTVNVHDANNDPPQAINDSFVVVEDSIPNDSESNRLNVLANDDAGKDPLGQDGDILQIQSVNTGSNLHGSVVLQDNLIYYTPAKDYYGPASFTYTLSDGRGGTDTAAVSIQVMDENDPPAAVDDGFTVAEDSGQTNLDVLHKDSSGVDPQDPDHDNLTVVGPVTGTYVGSVSIAQDGRSIRYTPPENFFGSETFGYTLSDGRGGTDTATAIVTVTEVNDPPVAENDEFTVGEDSSTVLDVLSNDTTVANEIETLAISDIDLTAVRGVVSTDGQSITFTPEENFTGVETFQYTVSDGNNGTDTAAVTVTVGPVNDPPAAVEDEFTITEDSPPVTFPVLANDTTGPDDGETLTIVSVLSSSLQGSATTDGETITFNPAADFFGTEVFSYTISDGDPESIAMTAVHVNVMPVNDLPLARDDHFSVSEDTRSVLDVLSNDTIAPDTGETLVITQVETDTLNGTITLGSQQLEYLPPPDFFGSEVFTYTIQDGTPGSFATAVVTVTVGPEQDPPAAENDAFTMAEDSGPIVLDVLANDTAEPGESLRIIAASAGSAGGKITFTDSLLIYTPALHFFGEETFFYTITDSVAGSTATGEVIVTVTAVNDAPKITLPDRLPDVAGALVQIQIHATDPDGDPLTFQSEGLPESLVLDEKAGVIRGALPDQPGNYRVRLIVSDNQDGAIIVEFDWRIEMKTFLPLALNMASMEGQSGISLSNP